MYLCKENLLKVSLSHKRSCKTSRSSSLTHREIQLKQIPIEASYFGGLDQEGGENIYDHVIEDVSKSANNTVSS